MKVFLLVSFAVTLLPNIVGSSYGDNLLARLDNDIYHMKDLIAHIQQYYRNQLKNNARQAYPKKYESTLRKAIAATSRASKLIKDIEGTNHSDEDESHEDILEKLSTVAKDRNLNKSTRRNNDLEWKTNVYKAISRALKDEFKDNEIIQENVHDGFVPPTILKKNNEK